MTKLSTDTEFNPTKVWEFIESRPFYNKDFSPLFNTAEEIFNEFIVNSPEYLKKYAEFKWSGSNEPHRRELANQSRRNTYIALRGEKNESRLQTYYNFKYNKSSRIFEAEEIKDLSENEIMIAEAAYDILVEKLINGEPIEEGFFGGLVGGIAGAVVGPAIGRAICTVLGIKEDGPLGKLLTSRLVTTAMGITLGK